MTFLRDGERNGVSLSYAEMDRRARATAAKLQTLCAPGDRALLLYAPGIDYVVAFLASLYAGVIAVPAYPPDPSRLARTLPRIQAIAADSRPAVILATREIVEFGSMLGDALTLGSVAWLATEETPDGYESSWRAPAIEPSTPAFIQYTSGSTGTPKGVIVTHANLLHNLALISGAMVLQPSSVAVFWLPPYHDMGLIGGILSLLFSGAGTVLMSPLMFLQRPMRWLEAFSRHRGTVSAAPNFAFDLCVRKSTPDERAALDLSTWQTAICGAEPVRGDTMDRFAEAFAVSGFRRGALTPCYGLAEATLLVSGSRHLTGHTTRQFRARALEVEHKAEPAGGTEPARSLVSSGIVSGDQRVLIVDPETTVELPPGREGEIWISGASVASGYWGRPEESERTFRAASASGAPGTFLRSGDLGFFHEGELFVTSRLKDLIIVAGRNHYPQDIERTVEEAHPALRPGCGAVFAIGRDGVEHVVVVHELERRFGERRSVPAPPVNGERRTRSDRRQGDPEIEAFRPTEPAGESPTSERPTSNLGTIVGAIVASIAEQHDLEVYAVILVKAGTVSKTSSGKIQRHACREAYASSTLDVVHQWSRTNVPRSSAAPLPAPAPIAMGAPTSEVSRIAAVKEWLISAVAARCGCERASINAQQPFTVYGMNSIDAVGLSGEIERWLGRRFSPTLFWDYPNVDALARFICDGEQGPRTPTAAPQTPAGGPPAVEGSKPCHLVVFSARTSAELGALLADYARWLTSDGAGVRLAELAYSTAEGGAQLEHRAGIVARSVDDLVEKLRAHERGDRLPGIVAGRCRLGAAPALAFVFGDHGTQWWSMGRELLEGEPVFRDAIEECSEELGREGGWSLLAELTSSEAKSRLDSAEVAQPALVAVQVALLSLWRSWGVTPDAVAGFGAGEISAAYAGDALTLRDAMRVALHRGRALGPSGPRDAGKAAHGLTRALSGLASRAASLRIVSSITGREQEGELFDAAYWGASLREPARMAPAIDRLVASGCEVLLEIGPHPMLDPRSLGDEGRRAKVVCSLRRREPERATLLESLATLHTLGVSGRFAALHDGPQAPIALPTSPLERDVPSATAPSSSPWKLRRSPGFSPWHGRRSPTSFGQELMWLNAQLDPASFYNGGFCIRLRGRLERAGVAATLATIVARHEVLRTTYRMAEGALTQEVHPAAAPEVPLTDLTALPEGRRREEAERLIFEEVRTRFDLERGPVWRASLKRLADDEHVLTILVHHIAFDGTSAALLQREFASLYSAHVEGQPDRLAPLPVQYADFARFERDRLSGAVLDEHIGYWRSTIAGAPASVDLPTDRPRPEPRTFRGKRERIRVSSELFGAARRLARDSATPEFVPLLAALVVTLQRWTGQADLVVGTVTAGRAVPEVEALIGNFVNFVPVRVAVDPASPLTDAMTVTKTSFLGAFARQACPFSAIVSALSAGRKSTAMPIYNVALLLQNLGIVETWAGADLQMQFEEVDNRASALDLRFIGTPTPDGALSLECEYCPDLFDPSTIAWVLEAYVTALAAIVSSPTLRVDEVEVPPALARRARAAREREAAARGEAAHVEETGAEAPRVVVTSTFTAEPLQAFLSFWFRELGMVRHRVEFAPFGQLFHQLVDPDSATRTNDSVNLILVRMDDWAQRRVDNAIELGRLLRAAAAKSRGDFVVLICPSPGQGEATRRAERELERELAEAPSIRCIPSARITETYPVEPMHDARAQAIGAIPYTSAGFAALGTAAARAIYAQQNPSRKVLVLDADGTLWKGICGEDGPKGVFIDAPRKALQEFALKKRDEGVLLCLCSKNNEADVREVFALRGDDMPLRLDDIVSHRVNWRSKSENLQSIAAELGLPLDTFVLLDDSAAECAEVRQSCPEVVALEIADDQDCAAKLEHVWAFERVMKTEEGRRRTAMYSENRQRERVRARSTNLSSFLATLELEVTCTPLGGPHLARASELTWRTNQFNCSGVRRTQAELEAALARGEFEGVAAHARDRFGDYGFVGLALFAARGRSLRLETFLLSCRALGRGVEHRIVAHLGAIARTRGLEALEFDMRVTPKNAPARSFLGSVGECVDSSPDGARAVYSIDVTRAASLGVPLSADDIGAESELDSRWTDAPPQSVQRRKTSAIARGLERAASDLRSPPALDAYLRRVAPSAVSSAEYVAPRTPLERLLAAVWEEVIATPRIGVHDDFFEIGGNSMQAARIAARLEELLPGGVELMAIFDGRTIAGLADTLARSAAAADIARSAELFMEVADLSDEEVEARLGDGAPAATNERAS